jgi:carbamate kinase
LPDRNVVTVLTEVVVDADDPAFAHPTEPIGLVYTAAAAAELSAALRRRRRHSRDRERGYHGVEAVIDKDLAAALLAE